MAKVGRPRAYETAEELESCCNEYFDEAKAASEPFLISGLCLYLGIHTETLREYGENPKYSAIVKKAKLRVQASLEVLSFNKGASTGALFNLKCNHGFRDNSNININIGGQHDNPVIDDRTRESLKEAARLLAAKSTQEG